MRASRSARRFLRGLGRPRFAALLVLAALLGAGLFLGTAYSAWAEDVTAVGLDALSSTDATTTAATTDSAPVEPASLETTSAESPPGSTGEESPAPVVTNPLPPRQTPPIPPDGPDPVPVPGPKGGHGDSTEAPLLAPHQENRAPESREGGYATIWLHRALPDPTPVATRLTPRFARELRKVSAAAGAPWSLVLAVARARGAHGPVPLSHRALGRLAGRLAALRGEPVVRIAGGNERLAAEIRALNRYDRAVGLRALVIGLEAAKPSLERRLLRARDVRLYAPGRADIAAGRVDVRVLVLIRYLAVTFHQVTISSLVSGHRLFARPGVVSAHVYGLAADISMVGRTPISGHQAPGGVTERAIEAILLLPAEVQPQQVISLLGLGGPSFPLPDHYDHIHVGF